MNGSEAARLRNLETFEGRFNELVDFNMYCKSIQGQRLTSCLLVMAPLEAKFNVRPADEKGSRIWLKCFMACDHSVLTKIMKTVAHTKGTYHINY